MFWLRDRLKETRSSFCKQHSFVALFGVVLLSACTTTDNPQLLQAGLQTDHEKSGAAATADTAQLAAVDGAEASDKTSQLAFSGNGETLAAMPEMASIPLPMFREDMAVNMLAAVPENTAGEVIFTAATQNVSEANTVGDKVERRAQIAEASKPQLHSLIGQYAQAYQVPERLVHRVVQRESRYNPAARNGPYWGLMQISHATARGMGYQGKPHGLLDANTNLRYAVKYLAGAYKVADGDEGQAVRFYARGYYYDAKAKNLLEETGLRKGPNSIRTVYLEPDNANPDSVGSNVSDMHTAAAIDPMITQSTNKTSSKPQRKAIFSPR